MKAVTVLPGIADSIRLEELADAAADAGSLIVQAIAVGVCGTDRDIVSGHYGQAPAGHDRLVLGHESLGHVLRAPSDSGFNAGDLVVGIVRRPDPVPCRSCAVGEWDMCRNGLYSERGIKAADGYAAERFALEPDFAIKVPRTLGLLGVLLEPASVLAKAWDHIEGIGRRTKGWRSQVALVTGAGPVGLLAALMAVQRGLALHVMDRNETGPKPELVRALGGTYHCHGLPDDLEADVILECTGAPSVILDVLSHCKGSGIVCLTGVTSGGRTLPFDVGAFNRSMVLQNNVVFGSVNANRSHYVEAAAALASADRDWLRRLVTRQVPLSRWREAFERRPGDIKVVLQFEAMEP